jgi:hypothetical protein
LVHRNYRNHTEFSRDGCNPGVMEKAANSG